MTMFAQAAPGSGDAPIANQLLALSRLESTPNAIRLRIAGLAPDQLYRGTTDQLSIAEEISLAVDRERAYLAAFQRSQKEAQPRLRSRSPAHPCWIATSATTWQRFSISAATPSICYAGSMPGGNRASSCREARASR